jgi:hypothetical protein
MMPKKHDYKSIKLFSLVADTKINIRLQALPFAEKLKI